MQQMGDFQLERPLGRGATAQVYLARRTSDGSRVALKVFHPGLWDQEDLRRRAKAEFATAGALKHPGIVQVLQPLWEMDPPGVALEYVEGCSLEELQPRLPYVLPELAALIVVQTLTALEYAHGQGVIHRDLKPANILISQDGRVLISDFGLARVVDSSRMTATGTILGSPDYMSPEQARGDLARAESDLFSVAAILYFLVTGTRPFSRHSPLATLAAVLAEEAEHPGRRNPKLSPALAALIRRGLSKKAEDRFRSAGEFKGALESYLESVGLGGGELTLGRWMREPTEAAMEALKTITRTLIERCESSLSKSDVDEALASVSHLSLVAPESGAIERLLEAIEAARKSRTRFVPWAALALLILGSGAWAYWRGGEKSPDSLAVSSAAPARPAVVAEERPPITPKKPVGRSKVNFDVPADVRVFWDGLPVIRGQGLPSQAPGRHRIRLEKAGAAPINQIVTVKAGEPTVIRVR